jgi:hypothetical protein
MEFRWLDFKFVKNATITDIHQGRDDKPLPSLDNPETLSPDHEAPEWAREFAKTKGQVPQGKDR